jgi:hypothetical protein
MSEFINNQTLRQNKLKELILKLHDGEDFDKVKAEFEDHFSDVTATEITQMETALVMDGMPVEHIQKLCDVHAAVFRGTIEEIHQVRKDEDMPGHPVHTLKLENEATQKFLGENVYPLLEDLDEDKLTQLKEAFIKLKGIDKHYARKENLIFPYMESAGITAPPKVMWGVDDEIRANIKSTINLINSNASLEEIYETAKDAVHGITEMIYKENSILIPMVLDELSDDQWQQVLDSSDEFGYFLITPDNQWNSATKETSKESISKNVDGMVQFDAGALTPEQINSLLNTLPLDMTFVDAEGKVRYFSQGKERIFARPKTIIGREVSNCHPPASVHVVEQIVEDLESGKKDNEDFWIQMGDQFVYIRYFAVRNNEGKFLGVLEVTQNIKPIQGITGEKRLMS